MLPPLILLQHCSTVVDNCNMLGVQVALHVAFVHSFVNPLLFLLLHRGCRQATIDILCCNFSPPSGEDSATVLTDVPITKQNENQNVSHRKENKRSVNIDLRRQSSIKFLFLFMLLIHLGFRFGLIWGTTLPAEMMFTSNPYFKNNIWHFPKLKDQTVTLELLLGASHDTSPVLWRGGGRCWTLRGMGPRLTRPALGRTGTTGPHNSHYTRDCAHSIFRHKCFMDQANILLWIAALFYRHRAFDNILPSVVDGHHL